MHVVDGVIARCFVHRSANPDAPKRLFVGAAKSNPDHPSKAMPRAVRLMQEGGPVLLFVRDEPGGPATFEGAFLPTRLLCTSAWERAHPNHPVEVDDQVLMSAGRISTDLRTGGPRTLSGVMELEPEVHRRR